LISGGNPTWLKRLIGVGWTKRWLTQRKWLVNLAFSSMLAD
jgi:hypothetical protein